GKHPDIANLIPSDIEIRRNYFFKPLSWLGSSYSVKNLLEFKCAQRVLVEGNTFQNVWLNAQAGWALLITPRSDDGLGPWENVADVTIRLNKFINVGQGIDIAGTDNYFLSGVVNRVLIENNLILIQNINGEDHRLLQFTNPSTFAAAGPNNVTVRHNTGLILSVGGGALGASVFSEMLGAKADQFDFRDNLLSNGGYGFFGSGGSVGSGALARYFTNYDMLNNVFIGGGPAGSYPANNFFPNDNSAVGFVNFAGGDYTLTSGSPFRNAATDGKDVGADIAAIAAAISGAGIPILPAPKNLRVQ
ncbi:MAG: hypothetical protein DMG97_15925, partial [Acidobacteria bacterium]